MMNYKDLLLSFNHHYTLFLVFPAIVCLGIYLTIRLRGLQFTKLKKSFSFLIESNSEERGLISRFSAVSTVLAGNFGTGNISGMAVALATGGPGALIWMWVMACLGAIIQYASCILGVRFRKKTAAGEYAGGPMYYLRDGLGYKLLGSIFAGCTMFGAITVGNFAQINSIVLPLQSAGIHPLTASIILALLVAAVIMGGIQRVARFSSVIVPVQAILYFGAAIWILTSYHQQILPALQLMFHSAFDTSSFVGGTLGMGMMQAITTGFDRGLFATDAGTGIVPILQASARSEQPVRDGLVTLVAPLMVMLVCTLTGLVLLVTGAWQEPGLQSTNMVTHAFSRGMDHPAGAWIVMIALLLFAYTTILAWSYCGEKALEFLSGSSRQKNWFRLGFVMLVPVGSLLQVDLIWILADIAIGFMLLINLIGITGLSRQVIAESRAHSVPIVSRS